MPQRASAIARVQKSALCLHRCFGDRVTEATLCWPSPWRRWDARVFLVGAGQGPSVEAYLFVQPG